MTTCPKCQWTSFLSGGGECGIEAALMDPVSGVAYCMRHAKRFADHGELVPIQLLTPAKESAIVPPSSGLKTASV